MTDKDAPNARPDPQAPTLHWDAEGMKTSYANFCNVSSTREEVTLLFGTNQSWSPSPQEVKLHLSDRVILNPYAAKRLAALLERVTAQYEARFGPLGPDTGA